MHSACRAGERIVRVKPVYIHPVESNRPVLQLEKADFCIAENGEAHRTSNFEIMNREDENSELVIRRGQEFFLNLHFVQDYDPKKDEVSIYFTHTKLSESESSQVRSSVELTLGESGVVSGADNWQASFVSLSPNSLKIEIKSPADVPIGKWKTSIETGSNLHQRRIFDFLKPIHILLNPWCSDDVVFMENEAERREYVLADDGCIYMGKENQNPYSIYWKFAQFQKDILDCAFYLVNEIADISINDFNNPIMISRGLSAAVNSQDDDGVLVGNWNSNNDFVGGKDPRKWTGSGEILQEYFKTKKPVKYGQCWVYGGVLATVCRAIGLPCRVVTNFESAHDYQANLRIDYFDDAITNKRNYGLSCDMVWDFHVWNEVWMKRLDLGPKYGGWQAIDATPQERSDGKLRSGPTSVVAIKNGDLQLDYDGRFAYAEVNADQYWWKCFRNGEKKLVGTNESGVGKMISTKAVGTWEREDLTDSYKFPENSAEERESMAKARLHCGYCFDRRDKMKKFKDIMFNMKLSNNSLIGEPFSVILSMTNISKSREYTVSVKTLVVSVNYTGKEGETVKISDAYVSILPGETKNLSFDHFWEDYGSKLLGQSTFKVSCSATVEEAEFEYFAQRNFNLAKPEIEIEISTGNGDIFEVKAGLKNPLPIPLTGGHFKLMGLGGDTPLKFELPEAVEVGDKAHCFFSAVPKAGSHRVIAVKFHSNELTDVQKIMDWEV